MKSSINPASSLLGNQSKHQPQITDCGEVWHGAAGLLVVLNDVGGFDLVGSSVTEGTLRHQPAHISYF